MPVRVIFIHLFYYRFYDYTCLTELNLLVFLSKDWIAPLGVCHKRQVLSKDSMSQSICFIFKKCKA